MVSPERRSVTQDKQNAESSSSRRKDLWPGRRWSPALLGLGLALVAAAWALKPPPPKPPLNLSPCREVLHPVLAGPPLSFTFEAQGNGLEAVEVVMVTYLRTNPSRLTLSLYRLAEGLSWPRDRARARLTARQSIPAAEVADWGVHVFKFPKQRWSAGRLFAVEISSPDADVSTCLGLVGCREGHHFVGQDRRPGQPLFRARWSGVFGPWKTALALGFILSLAALFWWRRRPTRLDLALLLLAGGLVWGALWWVPLNQELIGYGWHYYRVSLFDSFQPRTLLGTVCRTFMLSELEYLATLQFFQFIWLFLLLKGLVKTDPRPAARGLWWLGLVALSVLFAFNQVVFCTNFFAGYNDVVTYALLLMAFWMIKAPLFSLPRTAAAAGLSLLAVLNHEASILGVSVLAAWTWHRFGFKRAAAYWAAVFAGWLPLVVHAFNHRVIPVDSGSIYISYLLHPLKTLAHTSGGLLGLFYAGGMLWFALAAVTGLFLSRARRQGPGALRRALVFAAVGWLVPLSQLLVASDTSRILARIWLPAFLLMREVDLIGLLSRRRLALAAFCGLAALQLALPPMANWAQRFIPLNYYSQAALSAVLKGQPQNSFLAWGGLIRLKEHTAMKKYYQKGLLPPQLIRQRPPDS